MNNFLTPFPAPEPTSQPRRSWRFGLWTGLLALPLAGCQPVPPAAPELPAPILHGDQISFATNAPQLTYLKLAPAQKQSAAAVALYGRLAWDDDLTVRVFAPVAGRVLRLPVEVNHPVAAGDTLALLDSPDYSQALADARTATGNDRAADQADHRTRELFAHGAAAEKDVEAAAAAAVAAHAECDRALAKLANYGGTLTATNSAYRLCSPLAGWLVEKNITIGQEIRPDLMLANAPQFTNPQFVVTDPKKLWLFLDLDEVAVTSLQAGQAVAIHTKAWPDQVFHGQLEMIGQELDPSTRTIKARCLVDNADQKLRAEMYVTADVTTGGPTGVTVPTQAVFLKDDQHYVFVQTAPAQFERRRVTLGLESNGQTAILGELSADTPVVTGGCLLLESILEGDNS